MATERFPQLDGPVAVEPCLICRAGHRADEACAPFEPQAAPHHFPTEAPLPGIKTPVPDVFLGRTLGNFKLTRILGTGGMGTVYLGEHSVIGSKVAVKVLHAHLASDASLVERFFAEARAVNLIGHENIVSIFDMSVAPPNRHYLIMEYLDGVSLADLAASPMAPQKAHQVLRQVCDALSAAHAAGIVHRDMKPENIFLVRRSGREDFVKLVDFGIAKLRTSVTTQTTAGLVVGTPEFMAPEQWGGGEIDGRADLYAVGLIGYILATGSLPFSGSMMDLFVAHAQQQPAAPRTRNPKVPPAFEQVILKALEKRREDRYQTAQELKQALDDAFEVKAVAPAPAPAVAVLPPRRASLVVPPPPRPADPPRLSIDVELTLPARAPVRVSGNDPSKGGMYLVLEGELPPMMQRLKVRLLAGTDLVSDAEVVRQVTPEQARAWAMSPGVAVQFISPSAAFRAGIEQLAKGLPLAAGAKVTSTPSSVGGADDAQAAVTLAAFATQTSDHYALLSLGEDADSGEIRQRGRQLLRDLEALGPRRLSSRQREQLTAANERVALAVGTLGAGRTRAEYDASRGNFRGVARCVAGGVTATELAELRKRYLSDRPGREGKARLETMAADSFAAKGQAAPALLRFEAALALDPLNLEVHQRYWALKRRHVTQESKL